MSKGMADEFYDRRQLAERAQGEPHVDLIAHSEGGRVYWVRRVDDMKWLDWLEHHPPRNRGPADRHDQIMSSGLIDYWERDNLGEPTQVGFVTKDSGEREEYESGMVRDTEKGKARFDLLIPEGIPYEEQMLTRFAQHMTRGAEKYNARNWEKATGHEELSRFKRSALRHLIQWLTSEGDEDHASAVMFNIVAAETLAYRMSREPR